MGRTEEAISLLASAIEKAPNNAQLYDVMGKLYETTDEDKSLEWYGKALAIDPEFTESNFNMGRVYYNKAVTLKSSDKYDAATDKKITELFQKALPYLERYTKRIRISATTYLLKCTTISKWEISTMLSRLPMGYN